MPLRSRMLGSRLWLTIIASIALIAPARGTPVATVPASTVLIAGMIGSQHAYGCAVIIAASEKTLSLLTAAHNLAIETPVYMTTRGEHVDVVARAPIAGHDLAVVTTTRPRGAFDIAAFASEPAIGTRVHMWGPIANQPFTPHDGTVRAMDARVVDAPEHSIAIDCDACDHGDSGTGVYDDDHGLIGVVTTGYFASGKKLFVLIEITSPARIAAAE